MVDYTDPAGGWVMIRIPAGTSIRRHIHDWAGEAAYPRDVRMAAILDGDRYTYSLSGREYSVPAAAVEVL